MSAHILVMNDTQEILELFNDILSEEGYQVTTYSYSPQEIGIVEQTNPDLIIADFPPSLREDQGWQFVQKLKMNRATAAIPIIICTTNLRAVRDNEGWMSAKGIVMVPKPFDVDELLEAVRIQLRRDLPSPSQRNSRGEG